MQSGGVVENNSTSSFNLKCKDVLFAVPFGESGQAFRTKSGLGFSKGELVIFKVFYAGKQTEVIGYNFGRVKKEKLYSDVW